MPKANGSSQLGNCYRVSRDGRIHGYFNTEDRAANYAYWYDATYGVGNIPFVIEEWFIEGEF